MTEFATPKTRDESLPRNEPASPGPDRTHHLDGARLRQLFETGVSWLEAHAPHINALNVFPVPDGDTGTNMLATMRSALKALAESRSGAEAGESVVEVARRAARGAVLGARGNSGVILSQILSGFAQMQERKEHLTAADLARAFRRASDSAYQAVMKPVEGTILTVARAVAEEAERAAAESGDVHELFRRVTQAAQEALARTPEMLPILKQAGVVDSGGQGLVTLLEGMFHGLRGEAAPSLAHPLETDEPQALPELEELPPMLAEGRYGYDIQYLIHGQDLDVAAIRAQINRLGECPLVVGDSSLVKVHVHALTPGPALDYGASQGMLDDVVVENLDLQFQAFSQKEAGGTEPAGPGELKTEDLTGVGIVAVAAGEGLAQHFRELGASAVIRGGQTMNPSTQELLAAVESVSGEAVILLPNNGNILLAARQAQELASRPVYVVPSRSAPQGFAAMMAFDYSQDGPTNAANMTQALEDVVTVEVTTAVRDSQVDGLTVAQGDVIGLLDGKLVATGSQDAQVIEAILGRMELDEYEFMAIYYGEDSSAEEAEALAEALAARYPELEIEVHPGGQPHYRVILSIE